VKRTSYEAPDYAVPLTGYCHSETKGLWRRCLLLVFGAECRRSLVPLHILWCYRAPWDRSRMQRYWNNTFLFHLLCQVYIFCQSLLLTFVICFCKINLYHTLCFLTF